MAKYTRPEEGEWVQPVRRGYKLACCDCGLVHTLDFRIYKGRAQFRAFRNERSTALMRRHERQRNSESASRRTTSRAGTRKRPT